MKKRTKKASEVKGFPIALFKDKGKREYLKRLNWLVDFLNAEISNLPTGHFLKFFAESLDFFYSDHVNNTEMEKLHRCCVDTHEDRQALENAQKCALANIMSIEDSIGKEEVYQVFKQPEGVHLHGVPESLGSMDILAGPALRWIKSDGRPTLKLVPEIYPYEDDKGRENTMNYVSSFAWFSKFVDARFDKVVEYGVLSLLSNFSARVIHSCPNCGKFIKVTVKKKSPLCARCLKKENTDRWRKENRPVYNTYQSRLRKGVKDSAQKIRTDLENEAKIKED